MENQSGRIVQIDSFPSAFVDPRPILIWLPATYDPAKKYPVLYMHDGQMLFDSTTTWTKQEWKADETMSRLITEQKIRDAIIVGIPNNQQYRWAEYIPQAILDSIPAESKAPLVRKWLQDRPLGDAYLKFITAEVKPYIDRHYATLPDAANTFIMGSSMGGIISLYAICEYPDVFSGAACLSTHWPLGLPGMVDDDIHVDVSGEFRKYLQHHLPSPDNHRIYFDYGSATLDSLYKPHQLLVDSLMAQKGYSETNWVTREFPGEEHTERAWARRLHIPLTFLLGKE
jgi:enterochelin esterase-like enzyme